MSRRQILSVRPQVSDHALVRFLQRSGMEVETVREALATALAQAHGAAQQLGGGDHLIVADDLMYVLRGGVVVTVLPAGGVRDRAEALVRRDRRPVGSTAQS